MGVVYQLGVIIDVGAQYRHGSACVRAQVQFSGHLSGRQHRGGAVKRKPSGPGRCLEVTFFAIATLLQIYEMLVVAGWGRTRTLQLTRVFSDTWDVASYSSPKRWSRTCDVLRFDHQVLRCHQSASLNTGLRVSSA